MTKDFSKTYDQRPLSDTNLITPEPTDFLKILEASKELEPTPMQYAIELGVSNGLGISRDLLKTLGTSATLAYLINPTIGNTNFGLRMHLADMDSRTARTPEERTAIENKSLQERMRALPIKETTFEEDMRGFRKYL